MGFPKRIHQRARSGTNDRLAGKSRTMKKTNFDRYLAEQMKDPEFAARFERANEDWDVALQLTALRQQAGLSQKELARRSGTGKR